MFHYHEKENKKRVTSGGRTLRKNRKESEHSDPKSEQIYSLQNQNKLRAKFLKSDLNGNGWLEEDELRDLLKELAVEDGPDLDVKSVLKDGRINFQDFYAIIQQIMAQKNQENLAYENQTEKESEVNKNKEEDGIGLRHDSISVVKRQLDKQKCPGLRKLLERTVSHLENDEKLDINSEIITEAQPSGKIYSRTLSKKDEENLNDYIEERWNAFINFKRSGKGGEIVMTSDEQLTDALPGTYDLLQLVMEQFDNDIVTMKPKHAVIKPVKWISAKKNEKHGQLLCPKYWNCTIPVEIGTEQNLSYYGCSYASKQQQTVALLHRHATVDFCYSENYKRNYVLAEEEGSGGCGIEMHAFHHMDCPLDDNSGYFLLAKLVNDNEIHITAFQIPKYHVLYVPPMVIHSNDHMLGTWRTMLADNVPIDHVHFMKETPTSGYYDNVDVIIEEKN